jgi:hypothetical protein
MRARKRAVSTYNMPEKHQIFARPNKTLKIIGTASDQHEQFLPAALITNTSCELIVPIQCTLHTRTMGQLTSRSQNSSCFPNPQEQGIANALYMQCNALHACMQVGFS